MLDHMHEEIEKLALSIIPFDDLEARHIQETQQWIASGAELFRTAKPATPPIHLVAYFVLIDQKTHQVLLTDHKRSGLWLPTGGHVEANEHPTETVRREIREELNTEADFYLSAPLFLTVTLLKDHTDISFWYVLNGSAYKTYNFDSSEFHSIKWFSIENIPYQQSDLHMQRFMSKLQKLQII